MAKVHNVRWFVLEIYNPPVNAHLAAALAHVRFFASMDACVYSQRGSLDELLIAPGVVAHMRSNATVYTLYAQLV